MADCDQSSLCSDGATGSEGEGIMGSILTFADLYRENPEVYFAPWKEFVVLFNSGNDEIRVRRSWNRGSADQADFVLHLKETVENGRKHWVLRPHSENITSMFLAHEEHGDLQWMHSSAWSEVDALDDWKRRIFPWEVFYFSFAPNAMHKDIGLMLHFKERSKGQESPDISQKNPTQKKGQVQLAKPTLDNLPPVVFRMIIANLPVRTAILVLPFVSSKMFRVVNEMKWERASLDVFRPSLRTLKWFTERTREACQSFTMFGYYDTSGDRLNRASGNVSDFYNTLFQSVQWTCLQEIKLIGHLHGFNPNALKAGLKKGNLPGLKTLKLEVNEGFSWKVLAGCPLPGLVHLTICIGERTVDGGQMRKFWDQFTALQSLKVVIESEDVWKETGSNVPTIVFPQPEEGTSELLPCLKTLTVAGSHRSQIRAFEAELQFFQRSKVVRLRLGEEFPANILPGSNIISSSWLFATFQHLSALSLDSSICLDWESVPEPSLQQLIHLRVGLSKPAVLIPFCKMPNLEAVCVGVDNANDLVEDVFSEWPSLEKLMVLPQLVNLKITGPISIEPFIPRGRHLRNVHSLDLGHLGWNADDEEDRDLEKFFELFHTIPQLARLVLPPQDTGIPAGDIPKIFQMLHNICYLEVPEFNNEDFPEVMSFFPDNSWEAFFYPESLLDYEDGNLRPMIFRKRHARKLRDEALLVFEDEFFSVS